MYRLLFLSLLFVLPGCSGGDSTSSSGSGGNSKDVLRLAVIPKGTTHEFWKSVHAGAQKAAEESDKEVQILWKGPLLENDREGQITVVQNFIVTGVDGIVLAPLDSQALVDSVIEATENDIPVVIFDSALANEDVIETYVATDNYQGGRLAAQKLAEAIGKKGNVIILRYNQGSESTEQREEGFLAAMQEDFPEVKVISSDQYAGTTPESSLEKATEVLEKYRDQVDGIFAVCEPNATGTLGALRETNLVGNVKFVAFDPNGALIEGMEKGEVDGIVLQDPVTMGYESVKALLAVLEGEEVEKRIKTGEFVATPENMKEDRYQELLHPIQVD